MAIYELCVTDNDFYDYSQGHDVIDRLPDNEYEGVMNAIFCKARDGFAEWFCTTDHWDKVWDAMTPAIDEYIELTAKEVIESGDYEVVDLSLEG